MWSPDPSSVEDVLGRLMSRGFRFVHPQDSGGDIVTVVGVRAHGNVVDVVRLDAEDDVTAMRLPGGARDILDPDTVLWRSSGSMTPVVRDLLSLRDDDYADEVTAGTHGCWVPGNSGRQKWLMATA